MKQGRQSLLSHGYLNGWRLFGLITLFISLSTAIQLIRIDTGNPIHISGMIAHSVRLAVPWLFMAFAASSLVTLFPGSLSKWLLRNRRMLGLCFAAGMAWQLLFILWLVVGFFDYYMAEAYSYYDLSEQIPGYLILFAMTFTSFRFGRSLITPWQWRFLHRWGIYSLWAVVWSTYWFELYYYDDIQPIDQVYYWVGIAAWGARIAAWGKKRKSGQKRKASAVADAATRQALPEAFKSITAGTLAMLGLLLIAFGGVWAPPALGFLTNMMFGGWIELFVPFLPMLPLMGAALAAGSLRGRASA